MSEIIHTIKEKLPLPSGDLTTYEFVDLDIKLIRIDGTVQFQWDIPSKWIEEARKVESEKYAKHRFFRSPLLETLKTMIHGLTNDIIGFHTYKDETGEKVIFIKFFGDHRHRREQTYGGDMGIKIEIGFQFFVGYRYFGEREEILGEKVKFEKYSSHYKSTEYSSNFKKEQEREGVIVPLHHNKTEINNLKSEFKIIPYTEDRYKFLKFMEGCFVSMTDQLNKYLRDLSEENLDHLIANNNILKILPPANE